jgi:hypothetical protein
LRAGSSPDGRDANPACGICGGSVSEASRAGFHYRFSTQGRERHMGRKIGALTVGTKLRGVVASADARR